MASGDLARSDGGRTSVGRRVARLVGLLLLLAMAVWIVVDLTRRGEQMAHDSLHWASGFQMPVVTSPSGIGSSGTFVEGYATHGETFTVHVTSTRMVSPPEVRVFRDRSMCGDTVWPYPQGGGPSGMAESLVWLEGVTSGPRTYAMDVALSNGGCSLYPHQSVTGVGSKLVMDNYLYTTEILRATLLDGGSQTVVEQWSMGNTGQAAYTPDQYEIQLSQPGLVQVQSVVRPWEIAFVLVCEHAHCAASDWEGKVFFTGVPHGTYTLHAWHFLTGEVTQPIVVDSNIAGQTVAIDFP